MEESTKVCNRSLGGPGDLVYTRCGGSLPLKKRRIMNTGGLGPDWTSAMIPMLDNKNLTSGTNVITNLDQSLAASIKPSISEVAAATALINNFPPPPPLLSAEKEKVSGILNDNREDEKIAALALVAARTSSTVSCENAVTQSPTPSSQSNKSRLAPESTASNPVRQRVYHPPLTQPLPNGCHGRTSRNNSYCRRYPRYNGSEYCKLHYQQYVLKNADKLTVTPNVSNQGTLQFSVNDLIKHNGSHNALQSNSALMKGNTPADIEAAKAMARQIAMSYKSVDLMNMYQVSNGHCYVVPRTKQNTSSRHGSHHQDKKFSNLPGEVPCEATTTRGRPCAYVSVNNTPYCHLHSEYGTNPPTPRRGCGNNQTQNNSKKNQVTPKRNGFPIKSSQPSNSEVGTNEIKSFSTYLKDSLPSNIVSLGSQSNCFKNIMKPSLGPLMNVSSNFIPQRNLNQEDSRPISHEEVKKENDIQGNGNSNISNADEIIASKNTDGKEHVPHKILSNAEKANELFKANCIASDETAQKNLSSALLSMNRQRFNSNNYQVALKLLSSLDSQYWENKRVRIMVGPLAQHTGRILRWGNGWVTLKTYVGLHNRRAFELQVLPDAIENRLDYDLADEPDESFWPEVHITKDETKEKSTLTLKQAQKSLFDSSNTKQSFQNGCTTNINDSTELHLSAVHSKEQNKGNPALNSQIIEALGSQALRFTTNCQGDNEVRECKRATEEETSKEKNSISLGQLASLLNEGSISRQAVLSLGQQIDPAIGVSSFDRTRNQFKKLQQFDDKLLIEKEKGLSDLVPQSKPQTSLNELNESNNGFSESLSHNETFSQKDKGKLLSTI